MTVSIKSNATWMAKIYQNDKKRHNLEMRSNFSLFMKSKLKVHCIDTLYDM